MNTFSLQWSDWSPYWKIGFFPNNSTLFPPPPNQPIAILITIILIFTIAITLFLLSFSRDKEHKDDNETSTKYNDTKSTQQTDRSFKQKTSLPWIRR